MMRVLLLAGALTAAAAPASAQALRWQLNAGAGGGASLDLLRPGIDVPVLELICADGRQVEISVNFRHRLTYRERGDGFVDAQGREAPWPASMMVASGAASTTAAATAEPSDEGGAYVITHLPAASPVLSAFATTGAIRFTSYGETVTPPHVPVANAARLVAACRR